MAIQNRDPRTSSDGSKQDSLELAVVVPNSAWVFDPSASSKKQSQPETEDDTPLTSKRTLRSNPHVGDYHKVFNHSNFRLWWTRQLLPNLQQKSLIILDNASYHKKPPDATPNACKLKKAELVQFLADRVPDASSCMHVETLRDMMRKWLNENVDPEIVSLAEAQGHKVVFTPPR